MKIKVETLDRANAKVLAELVVDPQTTERLKVQILNKLTEGREGQDFFLTLFEEALSLGNCPYCNLQSHWGIPENNLNEMSWVSYKRDPRVHEHSSEEICSDYQESCLKKKITV